MKQRGYSKTRIEIRFSYDLHRTVEDIRPDISSMSPARGPCPSPSSPFSMPMITRPLKNAISLGGNADTMACIAGGIAQAYYKHIPADIVFQVREKLPKDLLAVMDQFNDKYHCEF